MAHPEMGGLVAPTRQGKGGTALRVALSLVCASVLLGYVAVTHSGGKSAAGDSATSLEEHMSGAPTLRSVDAIRKLAVQQGKELAHERAVKYAKMQKEEGDSSLPLDEQRTPRSHIVGIDSSEPANEAIIKNAAREGRTEEEENERAAERLLVTSSDENKLMGEERKVVASRDAKWRQTIAREAKQESQSFASDQKNIRAATGKTAAGKKGAVKGVETHLKQQVSVITSGEGKSNAHIAAVAAAAEAREERHLEEQVSSITGVPSAPSHSHTAAAHKSVSKGHHAISAADAEAAVKKLEASHHFPSPSLPVAARAAASHHAVSKGHHAISAADAEAAVKKLEAAHSASSQSLPVPSHAAAPYHAVSKGKHAISAADAEAAVKKLEAEHRGSSPSLHYSKASIKERAAQAAHLKAEVEERMKQEEAFNARTAAAAAPHPQVRAEEAMHTFARDAAKAHTAGGHHISMGAAEAAVKKLEAGGGGDSGGFQHTAAVPHPRMQQQRVVVTHQEQKAAGSGLSGGHHISIGDAEAAVKKLEAAGKH